MSTDTQIGNTARGILSLFNALVQHDSRTDPVPDGLRYLMTQTPLGSQVVDNSGASATERLLQCLATYQHFDRTPELLDIVDELGAANVWQIVVEKDGPFRLVQLIDDGVLPGGVAVLEHGAAYPDAVEVVLRSFTILAEDLLAILDYLRRTRRTSAVELLAMTGHQLREQYLPDAVVERLVTWIGEDLQEKAHPASGWSVERRLLSPEQVTRLLDTPNEASVILAMAAGFVENGQCGQVCETAVGRTLWLATRAKADSDLWDWFDTYPNELRIDMLDSQRCHTLLAAHHVAPAQLLLDLLEQSQRTNRWILGEYGKNQPTSELIHGAVTRGLVDAAMAERTLETLTRQRYANPEALAELHAAFAEVPGLPSYLIEKFAKAGNSVNTIRPEDYTPVLALLESVFVGDRDLWARFANPGPASPFLDKDASFSSVVDLYQRRWSAAAARRGR